MALVELGRFERQEAYIVQSALEDAGLMSFVFDADANMIGGGFLTIPVRVMVDDDDLAAARNVVAERA